MTQDAERVSVLGKLGYIEEGSGRAIRRQMTHTDML